MIATPRYLLDNVFNRYVMNSPGMPEDGEVIYWRDCVLREGMIEGTQGYIWVFADGESLHSYRTPEQVYGSSK